MKNEAKARHVAECPHPQPLSTLPEHLIRPAATFSPSDAEKESAPSAEAFITKETVAERLCVKPETVGRWANAGRLPSHRFGRRLRFKWSEVEQASANQK